MQVRVKQNIWLDGRLVDLGACVDLPDEQACGLCERGLAEVVDAFAVPDEKIDPVTETAPCAPSRKKKK